MSPYVPVFQEALCGEARFVFASVALHAQRVCAPLANKKSHPGGQGRGRVMVKRKYNARENY